MNWCNVHVQVSVWAAGTHGKERIAAAGLNLRDLTSQPCLICNATYPGVTNSLSLALALSLCLIQLVMHLFFENIPLLWFLLLDILLNQTYITITPVFVNMLHLSHSPCLYISRCCYCYKKQQTLKHHALYIHASRHLAGDLLWEKKSSEEKHF